MRRTVTLVPVLLLSALAAGTTSCSTFGVKQSLAPQLEEVRATRAELTASWEALGSDLDRVEQDVAAFCAQEIDTDAVDPRGLRDAIALRENATVDDVAAAKDVVEARAAAPAVFLDNLDSSTRAHVEQVLSSGQQIHQQLGVALPASLGAIAERAATVAAELAVTQATADHLATVVEQNPLMTAAEKQEFASQQAALDAELKQLEQLADRIVRDGASYGQRLTAATTAFDQKLASLDAR